MDEKRRHPRTATSMDVVYFIGGDGMRAPERIHYFGTITDLSRGGARLVVDQPHRAQEHIWVQGLRDTADTVPGRVRWVRGQDGRYQLGVEFLKAV